MTVTKSIVAICTKDRPDLLARALDSIVKDRHNATVVVVDASTDSQSKEVCLSAMASTPTLEVAHHRATRPGLARQRNEAARICNEKGAEVVHFLDDDAVIYPGYFEAIEACFDANPTIGGVGGAVQNPPPETHPIFNRFFLLSGRQPYTVAKSGRVVNPHTVIGEFGAFSAYSSRPIQWLQGFSMSYRMKVLNEMEFNERLSGYSYGEDRDFSFRVSNKWGITVTNQAKCEHQRAESSRMDSERFGFESTILTYAWISEWRSSGYFSRTAFFWSVFGDILRHLGAAMTNHPGLSGGAPLPHVLGIIRGIRAIISGNDLYELAAQ